MGSYQCNRHHYRKGARMSYSYFYRKLGVLSWLFPDSQNVVIETVYNDVFRHFVRNLFKKLQRWDFW